MRIGYLLAEFPASTHTYNWRELRVLESSGLECDLISTRRPEAGRMSHEWTQQAIARTTYLNDPLAPSILDGLLAVITAGPGAWRRVLRGIFDADGLRRPKDRLRLAALAVMGGRLLRVARRREWNYVHVHSCADAAHVAMFAHLLGGLRYGLTLHATLQEFGPNQTNKWRHAEFAICITDRLREVVRREMPDATPKRIDVAPMGVELDRFVRSGPYLPWDGNGPARLFACGRLDYGKGHDELLRAIALLRDQGLDVRLRIAGADDPRSPGYRAVLNQLLDDLKIRDRVEFLGGVSEPAVRNELEQAHVFTLASRRDELGVATMEAMAMGVPVVVSRGGGVTEMIDEGVDGILVEAAHPPAIAEGIARVLRDPALALRLSATSRRKIESRFHSRMSASVLLRYLGLAPNSATRPLGNREMAGTVGKACGA
jgi:colanic acid/amylovoran biosynthesis glycosyltransferase